MLESISMIVTIVVMSMTALYFLVFREQDTYKGKSLPPYCPSGYIESVRQLTTSNSPWFLLEMAHKVGFIFRLRMPTGKTVIVGDPQLARSILKDPHCQVKPAMAYEPADMLSKGPSVFSADGHRWAHARKGISPSFSSAHIKRMNRVCEDHVQKWIESRRNSTTATTNGDDSFNVSEEMVRLTIRVICESAFEYDITSEEVDTFLYELELSIREFLVRNDGLGIRKTVGPYLLEEHRRAHVASDRLEQFALKVIQAHRDNPHSSSETVLGRIINNPNYKDDLDRASDVIIMLVGGYDTTGYTLAWIFLELARHPEEIIKLRNDLLQQGPDNWKQSLALKNVIREAMRLNPVAALGSVRAIGRDVVYGKNKEYIIPKDTTAFLPNLVICRNPDVYEKADQFIPSRWETMNDKGLEALMPFSMGSRNCVGQSLANAELYSTVARVVMNFDLEVVEEGKLDYFLTLKPDGALLRAKPLTSK